jgi:hypothetical protein
MDGAAPRIRFCVEDEKAVDGAGLPVVMVPPGLVVGVAGRRVQVVGALDDVFVWQYDKTTLGI